jgi:hypothetical protein
VKNIQVNLILFRSLICIFEANLQDTSTRCEKYSSELDIISLAYSYLSKKGNDKINIIYMSYYVENARQCGPVKVEDLINCGVTAQTLVWTQGMANWTPAGEVEELKALFATQPPAFCPPPPTQTPPAPPAFQQQSNNNYYNQQQNYYQHYREPSRTMSFGESIEVCFRKYVGFEGRATRAEFWWFYLFIFLIGCVPVAGQIAVWGMLLPYLAVATRRLHDTNHSGWWILCPIYNIILLATKGDEWQNEYGEPPVV